MRRAGLQQTKCEGRWAACQRQKPRLKSDRPGRRVFSTPPPPWLCWRPGERPLRLQHSTCDVPKSGGTPVEAGLVKPGPAPLAKSQRLSGSLPHGPDRSEVQTRLAASTRADPCRWRTNATVNLPWLRFSQPVSPTEVLEDVGGKLQAIPCDLDPCPLSPVKATGGYEVH